METVEFPAVTVTLTVVEAVPLWPVEVLVPLAVTVNVCCPTLRLTNVEYWPPETVAPPRLLPFSVIETLAPSLRPVTVPAMLT